MEPLNSTFVKAYPCTPLDRGSIDIWNLLEVKHAVKRGQPARSMKLRLQKHARCGLGTDRGAIILYKRTVQDRLSILDNLNHLRQKKSLSMDLGTLKITIKPMFKSKQRKQNHRPLLHRGLHTFSLYERTFATLHAPGALQRAGANRRVIPRGGGESRRSVRLGLQLEFPLQAAPLRTEIRLRTSLRFLNPIAYLRARQAQALRGDCLVMVTRIEMTVVNKAVTPNKITAATRMSLVNKAGTSI
ncbi:uncharacterized protein J3D65DRAFT_664050 [Phyllosticta citribraziliensis]|uniref:Uncharacterized protein n=1 Tax=Phyllosticta citribraziliensis TaxID=989973 RepID=A0ABR1MCA9_9PEZI